MPNKNSNLNKAKSDRNDEFYTRLEDIEAELQHYKHHFKDKVVYCNCDDPEVSNFFKYFSQNFNSLGLKKLITSCYRNSDPEVRTTGTSNTAVWLEYNGEHFDEHNVGTILTHENVEIHEFAGDGDFRSNESIELLKQADIVVTNPPFSLFREFVAQMVKYDKKFLILGSMNAIKYKDIAPLLINNSLWLGHEQGDMAFSVPKSYEPRETRYWQDDNGQKWRSFGNMNWYTNMDFSKRHEDIVLTKHYTPEEYPTYDNYDAINVDKVKDIPLDYDGVMGVPITIMTKHSPEQFEICGILPNPNINGKEFYTRMLIKHKK